MRIAKKLLFGALLLGGVCISTLFGQVSVLTLERSTDGLGNWEKVAIGSGMVDGKGDIQDQLSSVGAGATSAFYRLRIAVQQPEMPPSPPVGMVTVLGGTLPEFSQSAGQQVSSLYIGKYEVTEQEWASVRTYALSKGYQLDNVGSIASNNVPVVLVNWFDVLKWCNAKSEKDGLTAVYQVGGSIYKTGQQMPIINTNANGYRLPTATEWEWAARGGIASQGYIYSGGNIAANVAWFQANAAFGSEPVGTKPANELGIYDMSGNVSEWCWDAHRNDSRFKLILGGNWSDSEFYCRVFEREANNFQETAAGRVGFRYIRKP